MIWPQTMFQVKLTSLLHVFKNLKLVINQSKSLLRSSACTFSILNAPLRSVRHLPNPPAPAHFPEGMPSRRPALDYTAPAWNYHVLRIIINTRPLEDRDCHSLTIAPPPTPTPQVVCWRFLFEMTGVRKL